MGSGSWMVMILAIAGIVLHMIRGIIYLRHSIIVDYTLADVLEGSSRKQESPTAAE